MALTDKLTVIADAIRSKTGGTDVMTLDQMATEIDGIEVGSGSSSVSGGTVIAKDVNFFDYSGTLLYSFTVTEAQALAELPAGPEHEGLTFHGWSLSLENVNALTTKASVNAMYTTNDGKTRLYITLKEGRTCPRLGLYVNGTVIVDWGDNSNTDTLSGTSTTTVVFTEPHAYAMPGNYVIALTVDGVMRFSGANSLAYVLGYTTSITDKVNQVYRNALRRVEIGNNVKNILTGFAGCESLEAVVIPNGVTAIGSAFRGCYSLAYIAIPKSVTTLGGAVSGEVFYDCHSFTSVDIPSDVTEIKSNTFYNCYGVAYYDFTRHQAVPTLSNTNAFTGISDDCEIRVPAALYDEWIAATNWTTYADYIKSY